jgi:glucosamine--fructose-6-phosphate aminotransferase (isomerizing)
VESLGDVPDAFIKEIAGQPGALRRAAAALADRRDALEQIREAGGAAEALVFTGMGSSNDACYPAVNELASVGISALLVNTAELLHFRQGILNTKTFLTIVSQSGASAEIVKLAAELGKQRARPYVVTITNGLSNPLAKCGDVALDTRAGRETAPSTMTFAASMVQLACVVRLLAGTSVDTSLDRTVAAAEGAASAVERLLQDGHVWAEELAGWLGDPGVIVILGRGPGRGAAEMGALLLKESGIMAESLESATFRHGPFELAGPGMAAIVLATEPETRSLDLSLSRDLVDAGASVLVVSPDGDAPKGALAAATGQHDRTLSSAISIVPVQLFAWRLSAKRGRIPGTFTRALKVTTRE